MAFLIALLLMVTSSDLPPAPNMKSLLRVSATLLFLLAAPTLEAQYFVNFETDAAGGKANGFQSAQSNKVSFAATGGGNLQIATYAEGIGQSLGAFGDAGNIGVEMTFTEFMNSLSLSYGNDDPGWLTPGCACATLTLFNGASQVGFVTSNVNGDDIMNQTIAFSGTAFDRALFQYQPDRVPTGLIEIIDNVEFTAATVVPEPSTYALVGLGMLALGGVARRRRDLSV